MHKSLSIRTDIGLAWLGILLWWLTWAAPNIGLDGVATMIRTMLEQRHIPTHLVITNNAYTWLISIAYWVGVFALGFILFMFLVMFIRDVMRPALLNTLLWLKNKSSRSKN